MFTIGMEMRDEYMSYEIAKGALTLAKDVLDEVKGHSELL